MYLYIFVYTFKICYDCYSHIFVCIHIHDSLVGGRTSHRCLHGVAAMVSRDWKLQFMIMIVLLTMVDSNHSDGHNNDIYCIKYHIYDDDVCFNVYNIVTKTVLSTQ